MYFAYKIKNSTEVQSLKMIYVFRKYLFYLNCIKRNSINSIDNLGFTINDPGGI